MQVSELIKLLQQVPGDSKIILAANGHYNFTDTTSHGKAQASHLKINGDDVFCISATKCGFDPAELNYSNLEVIKRFDR